MVGVLRSKACNACRARRKKCDEGLPVCGPCSKRGASCIYRSDINFIFFQPPVNDDTSSSASHTTPTSSTDSRSISHRHTPQSVSSSYTTPFDLPPTVLLAAQSSQARGFFLDNFLPRASKSHDLHSNTDTFSASGWYKDAGDLAFTDPLLDDALIALSLKYAEQNRLNVHAAVQAQVVYSRVVNNLHHRLSNPNESMRDSTLAAVMALTTWEAQAANRNGALGWMSHVKGSLMLVQLRGARNFSTDFAKKLFLGSMLSNLVGAIGTRKALPPMMNFAAESFQGEFASHVKLFQVLQTLPAILEQCDVVNRITGQNAPHSEVLTQASIMTYMVRDFESRLLDWTAKLPETPDEPLFWKEPSGLCARLPPDHPSRVLTHFNCFRSLDMAQQVVFSWSCHVLANLALGTNVMALKANGYQGVSAYATDTDGDMISQKLYRLSVDILMSFEYFLHPDMGLTAIEFLGLPMNLTYAFMAPRGFPEVPWFGVLFERIQEISPGFGELLQAMARQGGGGKAFTLLVQKPDQVPVVQNGYADCPSPAMSSELNDLPTVPEVA